MWLQKKERFADMGKTKKSTNSIIDNANFKKNKCGTNGVDTTFSVDLVRFTELECDIIKFKISGEKLNNFLSEKKVTNKTYYDSLKNIKTKLQQLYHENP